MSKLKVGIIGASGYAGAELLRLLLNHPDVEVAGIFSKSYQGEAISDLYPGFNENCKLKFIPEDEVIAASDLVFASLPHGLSETIAKTCKEQGKKFIDIGADFRLDDEKDYKEWYKLDYNEPELHKEQVYGLCEVFREKIKDAAIIGNPGCYPTSVGLALYPALKNKLIKLDHIIVDSKSGTTGSGKGLSDLTHFPRCNEAFSPYKVGNHRHTPEIEQTIYMISGEKAMITFVPHLLPINRGIISTIYADLNEPIELEKIYDMYKEAYKDEKFVRVLDLGKSADLKFVKYSNYCDISLHLDARNNRLIMVGAIDNMVKGAAGQAIQNMNIMYGFKEDEGLNYIPPSF